LQLSIEYTGMGLPICDSWAFWGGPAQFQAGGDGPLAVGAGITQYSAPAAGIASATGEGQGRAMSNGSMYERATGVLPSFGVGRPSMLAAAVIFAALLLPCAGAHAELLFRSTQSVDGSQQWSEPKKYSDPSNTAYTQARTDEAPAAPDEVQVIVSGFITADDVAGAKVLEALLKAGKQRIAGNLVSFASSGGEFDASMELGRVLRKLGVSTIVGRDDQCLSSCVFAFMGGDRRIAAGQIGIHRPYFSSTRYVLDRRVQYRQLQKKLREYIEELDFPPSLYEEVMSVSSEAMRVLSPADLKRFYLDGMSPSAEEEADAESARRLDIPIQQYLRLKAQACAGPQAAACAKAAARAGVAVVVPLQEAESRPEGALGLGPARTNRD
jgi:hypothetical protein